MKGLPRWPGTQAEVPVAISLFSAFAILILDYTTSPGVPFQTLYITVILIAFFVPLNHYAYIMAGITTAMILIGQYMSSVTGEGTEFNHNRIIIIVTIWLTAVFVDHIQSKSSNFYSAIDKAADAIINIDSTGIIISFNQGAQILFGYTPRDVIGQNVSVLMSPRYRKEHDEYIARYPDKRPTEVIGQWREFKAARKDGEVFPVELSLIETYQRGELMFLEIIRDISGRVQAAQQLGILSRAIEQSPGTIIITDYEGTIDYVNPKFCEVSGYSQDEVIGQNSRILKSKEIPSDDYKPLWETITSGNEWRGLFQNQKKNGELYWESASVSPVKNNEGIITHFLSVQEDITEQLETEKQLAHALKLEATGQLTSGIAHDFNNLLTIITGNMQLLMDDKNKFDRIEEKEILADIYSAAKDGEELIQRLLLLLRKNKPKALQFDVNQIIQDLKKVLGRMLGEDINVNINLDNDNNIVFADPNQLESALLNLAANSRDAMPNGGSFTIEVESLTVKTQPDYGCPDLKPGKYIAIHVMDNGIGMDQDVIKHAHEPFFTTKEAGKGSGLGLSMVYNFTRQTGGNLQIESNPGTGSVITMYLPESTSMATETVPQQSASNIPRGNKTILVVEDNKNVRRFTVRSLESLGYQVLESDNSNTAMEILTTEGRNIDLLFSDIVIPGNKNGHELALWSMQHEPDLRVALTTGLRTEAFDEHILQEEGIPLLRKPYSLETLAHFIHQQLTQNPALTKSAQ